MGKAGEVSGKSTAKRDRIKNLHEHLGHDVCLSQYKRSKVSGSSSMYQPAKSTSIFLASCRSVYLGDVRHTSSSVHAPQLRGSKHDSKVAISGCGSAECALSFVEKAVDIKQPVHTQHGPAEALSVCLGFSHSIESEL